MGLRPSRGRTRAARKPERPTDRFCFAAQLGLREGAERVSWPGRRPQYERNRRWARKYASAPPTPAAKEEQPYLGSEPRERKREREPGGKAAKPARGATGPAASPAEGPSGDDGVCEGIFSCGGRRGHNSHACRKGGGGPTLALRRRHRWITTAGPGLLPQGTIRNRMSASNKGENMSGATHTAHAARLKPGSSR
eukprot:14600487-Alexandrium_andersonii.AAC.1